MDQVLTRAPIVVHVVSAQPLQDQTRLYYAISGGTSQLYLNRAMMKTLTDSPSAWCAPCGIQQVFAYWITSKERETI